jgi:uncharacterized protein YnzC (UPF0291/DUF896 family)
MEQRKIDRINELARKAKLAPLSPEETEERDALRAEYRAHWRAAAEAALENTYIQRPNGTREKLRRKK